MAIEKWTDWPVEVHELPEQIERMLANVDFMEINHINKTGTTSRGYSVSLAKCSCPDFSNRHRPCKHMYALASDLELLEYPKQMKRSKQLIADFSSGLARDWAFGIYPFHWSALDIKWTPRKVDGKTIKEPTQGILYDFPKGFLFYNNDPELYEAAFTQTKFPKIALMVMHSTPTKYRYAAQYTQEGILNLNYGVHYGTVKFDAYIYKNRIPEKPVCYYATADQFVQLLKDGYCTGIENKRDIDISFTKILYW